MEVMKQVLSGRLQFSSNNDHFFLQICPREEVMLSFPISYEYFEYFIVSVFSCLSNNALLVPYQPSVKQYICLEYSFKKHLKYILN